MHKNRGRIEIQTQKYTATQGQIHGTQHVHKTHVIQHRDLSNTQHMHRKIIVIAEHPEKIVLVPWGNPWECDSRLCWMREAQREGWLHFLSWGPAWSMKCANFPDLSWEEVDLGCGL